MPSGAVLRSTIDPTRSGTVMRRSATAGPARSISRRAFSTESRADSKSISPISRSRPGHSHRPARPGPQPGRPIDQIAPCARPLTPPRAQSSPPPCYRAAPASRSTARGPDLGARCTVDTRSVAGPDTPNRQNLLETSPTPTDRHHQRAQQTPRVTTASEGAQIPRIGTSYLTAGRQAVQTTSATCRPHHTHSATGDPGDPLQGKGTGRLWLRTVTTECSRLLGSAARGWSFSRLTCFVWFDHLGGC